MNQSNLTLQRQYKTAALTAGLFAVSCAYFSLQSHAQDTPVARATVTVRTSQKGKAISPDLFGIFFEDLNYAADGGLYAELIQNRSFEYSPQDNPAWNSLTGWDLVQRGGGKGSVKVETAQALHANNPQHAVLTIDQAGDGVGLINAGFDGIVLKAGEKYDFSCFARRIQGQTMPFTLRLESKTGTVYGEATFPATTKDWRKYTATIQPNAGDSEARLVLLGTQPGSLALDMVSLFPQKTFHNHPNGLRPDLAQTIADLHPKFVRFPGGCLAHGDGIDNIYRWKNTIGPIERRKAQPNIWRYHQTTGLGYFEYFQFCEDIGAKPLPVVAAGVSCQNSDHQPGTGQQAVPLADMDEYVQDVLDLVEYANGPATSFWGAKRAAAGHPAPFNLQYLGVGNEDHITPEFQQRFEMINRAVKAKYPKLTVIGTVGPSPSGFDYDEGWKIANQLKLQMVDEHYYEQPDWFLSHLNRYDSYDRAKSQVYLGEYASWGNTLGNALAEAAYMASLERNGDIVHLSSYAPLLAKSGHTQWNPDLIYFDNTKISPSVNYYVQQMYGANSGETYLPNAVSFMPPQAPKVAPKPVGFLLGTWNTQAEFDDVRIESGAAPALTENFAAPTPNWNGTTGQWQVKDGAFAQTGAEQPALSQVVMPGKSVDDQGEYTYSLRARKTGGNEGFLIGFGATDASNYYWWNLGGWNNTQHGIEKKSGDTSTPVGDRVPGTIETNRWYQIKIVVTGKRFRCYLDDKLIQDVTDDGQTAKNTLVASSVKDEKSGDVILKLVNISPFTVESKIDLGGLKIAGPLATKTVLAGDPGGKNSFEAPRNLVPQVSTLPVSGNFTYSAPAHSFTVLRLKTR